MPSQYDIARQQNLLAMYRAFLVEYLLQRQQWERTGAPKSLQIEIDMLRGHIMDIKGMLRGLKVDIDNHPDDLDPDDDIASEVRHQRELLTIHRSNLAALLWQQKQVVSGQALPMLVNSLEFVRNELRRIKGILRGFDVVIEDLPEEEED